VEHINIMTLAIGVTFYCDGGVRSPPLLEVVVIVTTTFWSCNEIYLFNM